MEHRTELHSHSLLCCRAPDNTSRVSTFLPDNGLWLPSSLANRDVPGSDSLAPKRVGELMYPIAQQYVHSVVLVSDSAILNAQRVLWDLVRVAAEPGGAAAFAALLSRMYVPQNGERVGVLICGGNTEAVQFI